MLNFPLVCRFCLIPSEINQTIGIFDGTNELPKKIVELTDIQVGPKLYLKYTQVTFLTNSSAFLFCN